MENTGIDIATTKIDIGITTAVDSDILPYFYIKWARNDKRYRISTSFRYLNSKYGFHINIIRNPQRIDSPPNRINYLLSLINNQEEIIISEDLVYYRLTDLKEETEIFFIERRWKTEINSVIVFFSRKHWSLGDYMEVKKWPR